ncbi:MAG: CDP-glycerol glycerophosphotransferase family protein [Bacillota bacterium]
MIRTILNILNAIIPKVERQIFFSSAWPFKDNVAAVFEEFLRHDTAQDYRIILDGSGLADYEAANIEHVKHKSLLSIWRFLRSKYVMYDVGLYGSWMTRDQISVNLWHGMPIKKFGYYSESVGDKRPTATYVISSSPFFVPILARAFGVPAQNVLVTGEPRNDYFFSGKDVLKKTGINKSDYKMVVMWMPTYRTSRIAEQGDDGAAYEFGIPLLTEKNIKVLDEHLRSLGILLIVKYHSLQDVNMPDIELSNVKTWTSEHITKTGEPLYSLLAQCDALITDYSSVSIDYSVLDRPMCFAYDDMQLYASKRGFIYENAESMMPGFRATTFDDLLQFLVQLSVGVDDYREARAAANREHNSYLDGGNSHRVLKQLGLLD